jgi:hypothetical protein
MRNLPAARQKPSVLVDAEDAVVTVDGHGPFVRKEEVLSLAELPRTYLDKYSWISRPQDN